MFTLYNVHRLSLVKYIIMFDFFNLFFGGKRCVIFWGKTYFSIFEQERSEFRDFLTHCQSATVRY